MKVSPRISEVLGELQIPLELVASRGLQEYAEATELMLAERGADGRRHRLVPEAAEAWRILQRSADEAGIRIQIVSAYRSVARQVELVRRKLTAGQGIEEVLYVLAPPGFSEHHTGRAIDVGTPEYLTAEEVFETTHAFRWLKDHAEEFGFSLSYPRNNGSGYQYEPWHWCYQSREPRSGKANLPLRISHRSYEG